jgi:hypothetical protein
MKGHKHIFSRLLTKLKRKRGFLFAATIILLLTLIGVRLMFMSHASGSYSSAEAESGTLSGSASIIANGGASGGKLVQFGTYSSGGSTCQSVAIPAYFDPSDSANPWGASTSAALGVGIMIANPASGPGTVIASNYIAAIVSARSAGIRVFGYVDTAYATDSIASVEANINLWKSYYNVTDIFFDESSSSATGEAYYQTLTSYVHQQTFGSLTILNPGGVPDQSYINAGDIIVLFEGDYTTYQTTTFPSWVNNYPAHRFYNIIYNVPNATSMTTILTKATQNNIGYVYATNDILPNPYDTVPSYLSTEAGQAHSNCSLK